MKVVLTIWENRISPVADSARQLLIVDIENRAIVGKKLERFTENSLFHRARKLFDLEVEIFICGAISEFFASLVEGYGIRLIPFIRGEAGEVVDAYLRNSLRGETFLMTGYSRR